MTKREPIKKPSNPETGKTSTGPPPSPHKRVILLVEDSPDDAFLFLDSLKHWQISVPIMVVQDGEEALAYLKREGKFADEKAFPPPCALFLDLHLPKVHGFEVLSWIKNQPSLNDLLVVILSHSNEVHTVNKAYTLGAHSVLGKPVAHQDLVNVMTNFSRHFAG